MMKDFLKGGTGIVLLVVVALGLTTGLGIFAAHYDNWFSKQTAEPRGQKAVRENTQANGAFRQAAYEGFFELCSAAQTDQDQIETLEEEKKDASSDRVDNLNTSISALKMSLSETVNEYNTKANEYTRAQFLDSKLPYPLNAKDTIQCV
jgi:hypothetical protein